MDTDESLAVSTMSRPTQGPSSSLEEFPQKIGVTLQEPKNKQPLNHLPQEPPESWGKSWKGARLDSSAGRPYDSPVPPAHLPRPLILASASPRRAWLLGRLGVSFSIVPSEVEEVRKPGEP